MATNTVFETETCSRCGGSGNYSYNPMWGTVCFKCHGKGHVYTKRGAVAAEFFTQSLTVTIDELEVGMAIWLDGRWRRVQAVDVERAQVSLETGPGSAHIISGLATFRRRANDDQELAEKRAAALALQDTLTKQGKPRKRQK